MDEMIQMEQTINSLMTKLNQMLIEAQSGIRTDNFEELDIIGEAVKETKAQLIWAIDQKIKKLKAELL